MRVGLEFRRVLFRSEHTSELQSRHRDESVTGVQTCALRSEEHTSELQSHSHLVCRLLLDKNDFHGLGGSVEISRLPLFGHIEYLSPCKEIRSLVVFFLNYAAPPEPTPLPLTAAFPI